jgi:serine/threonine-protein kinase
MGTVHLGRILGAGGFSRVVAVKRLYPWFASDGEFRQMLLDEARFVSRIRHPNVVPTLDVVEADKDLYVVMEYVHGVSLAHLLKHCRDVPMPVDVATGILEGVLAGLHAAHEARGEDGSPLGIVHRDVSPQNILVGADGIARLIDFGIAKAATRLQVTDPGVVKGKIDYMAPEQLLREPVARQADVYSCGIVLWEMLANRRLNESHEGDPAPRRLRDSQQIPPSRHCDGVSEELDQVVMRALSREPKGRFPTAEAMALALRAACAPANVAEVGRWVHDVVADDLEISDERVRLVELAATESSQDMLSPHVISDHRSDSEIPKTTRDAPSPRGAWAWRTVTIGGLLLVAASAGLALRSVWRGSASVASASPRPPSATEATFAPPTVAASSDVPASASAPPSPHGTASPVASSAPSASPPARAPAARAVRPSSKSRCDPPYTVDASGRKHYDPSCF